MSEFFYLFIDLLYVLVALFKSQAQYKIYLTRILAPPLSCCIGILQQILMGKSFIILFMPWNWIQKEHSMKQLQTTAYL